MTNGERQFRRRTQTIEKKNFYAVCRENICSCLCEKPAVISAVVRNSHFDLLIGKTLLQVICIALCGHANCILVHSIGANAHNSTKASRTELQVFIKSV